jgi:DNA-binding transcriptional MerR regulator
VAPSTLNSWSKRTETTEPLVEPSLLGSSGKRADRYWSVQDLVVVRTIKALRQAGCPLQQLRKAKVEIAAAWDGELSSVFLYWDGNDLVATDPWGSLRSLVKHPGQQMLHLVAVPLDRWKREADQLADKIELEEIKKRRAKRAGKDREPELAAPLGKSRSA